MKREMSVNGSFYPDAKVELHRYFEHFNKHLEEQNISTDAKQSRVVIVPHAGYVYSGYSANLAYKVLANSKIKNIVVIGPSHRVAFSGVSLCNFESYKTPLGDIHGSDLAQKLRDKFSLTCFDGAHKEHSTEVQFPFIKHYLDEVKIVELVYSQVDARFLSKIIDFVLEDENCGVIISTDLSHFYNQKEANSLDAICLDAIKNLDIDKLHSGCEACGITGVQAMMISAKKLSLDFSLLDYRTSADASGDSSRVVGYMSGYFNEKV
ncbi:AmmeMemoRadiSam system protein B [Sulfurimonas sp.]|uniref:AmmeMemoRadiSam system protein B n=1 Tax=Sulfurimonas sp. TaxID=2022749 RepID=UPI002AB1FE81|nr:AmmeMemoRadiSam system protein B [Sulfurimonas sp.]